MVGRCVYIFLKSQTVHDILSRWYFLNWALCGKKHNISLAEMSEHTLVNAIAIQDLSISHSCFPRLIGAEGNEMQPLQLFPAENVLSII